MDSSSGQKRKKTPQPEKPSKPKKKSGSAFRAERTKNDLMKAAQTTQKIAAYFSSQKVSLFFTSSF